MPDWRDPSAYEFTRSLTTHQWAWEFLRRNPEYKKFWAEYQANWKPALDALIAAIPSSELKMREIQSLPEALPLRKLEERWTSFGLKFPVDPAEPASVALSAFFIRVEVHSIAVYDDHLTIEQLLNEWPGYPFKLHLEFVLGLPLEAQLRIAAKVLERHREVAVRRELFTPVEIPKGLRFRRGEFSTYLRILDGREAKASLETMGKVIRPDAADLKRTVKLQLQTALQVAREGYRNLLLETDGSLIEPE